MAQQTRLLNQCICSLKLDSYSVHEMLLVFGRTWVVGYRAAYPKTLHTSDSSERPLIGILLQQTAGSVAAQ